MKRKRHSRVALTEHFLALKGICHLCGGKCEGTAWDWEHVIALGAGGKDELENMRPAHRKCHASKTATDRPVIAKTNRLRASHLGIRKKPSMPGSRGSKWKRKMDGTVVER
jgi:5-methylcytosine-specific restriction endonuclease McrA